MGRVTTEERDGWGRMGRKWTGRGRQIGREGKEKSWEGEGWENEVRESERLEGKGKIARETGRLSRKDKKQGLGNYKKDREGREGKRKLGKQKENVQGMQGREGEGEKLMEGWQIRKEREIQGSKGLERGSLPPQI